MTDEHHKTTEKRKPSAISVTGALPSDNNHVSVSQSADRVNLSLQSGAKASILLYGATIVSWTIKDHELLFLSSKAKLDGSKAVRGGIPLVFPVFGKSDKHPEMPQHGFARTSKWEFLGRTEENEDSVRVDLGLGPEALTDEMKKLWGYKFGLIYSVTLTKWTLETKLVVQNGDENSFDFNALFHTYFKIPNVDKIQVQGLKDLQYKDKTKGGSSFTEENENIAIQSETDRVYQGAPNTVVVKDNDKPIFTIDKVGLEDFVVWNPYDKASSMGDFGPEDGYKHMLCVEAGSVAKFQTLEPGATWEGGVVAKAHL